MLELKVRKIGNSLGIVFPKESLLRLRVKEGESLYFTETPDGGYRVTGYRDHSTHIRLFRKQLNFLDYFFYQAFANLWDFLLFVKRKYIFEVRHSGMRK
jgi:putative addiction module antidote